MGILDHRRAQRLLDAYVDDELDDRRNALVLAHLVVCRDCRRDLVLTDMVKVHLSLRRLASFGDGWAAE